VDYWTEIIASSSSEVDTTPRLLRSMQKLENVANENALQLEAARRYASPFPLQLRRHAKFEVAEPCRIIASLLLINYFTP